LLDIFSLKGYVSVITGAAGGLGRAMALALAEAGSHVVVSDVNLPGALSTAEMVREKHVESLALQCDISDPSDVSNLAEESVKHFGKVDVLVNNAGAFQDAAAEEMDFENEWRRVMRTNLDGTFLMSQAFGRIMIKQRKGSIVNIASKSGIMVDYPNKQAAYNTSKAGIIMLTKSLAVEWAPYNVRVNCICPGNFVANPGLPCLQPGHPYREAWLRNTPMGHFGMPDELCGVLIYLASPASSFTTGAAEVVDGGFTII